MSLGSSDMAGSVLGTAFPLLLLSIIQGQDVDVFYKEKIEAVVGQDVVFPCFMENRPDVHIVSIEWSKNKDMDQNTKLALYSPKHPVHLFLPNVTMQIPDNSKGSYLNLSGVTEWDSGIYVCDLATFPLGSIRRETELKIKDVMCDVKGTVEVNAGENVTIQCSVFSDAQYWWTKNEELVSDNKPLELLWVTDADTGVYKLTVNAGNKRLHKEFNVTVLTATTTTRTGLATVSPRSNITEDGLIESAGSSLTTSPTTVLTTTDANVTWTISMSSDGTSSDATDDNSNINNNVTLTSYTNNTQISLTSTPATHTDLYYSNNNTDQDINATHTSETSTFSDQSVTSNLSATLSYGSTDSVFKSTQETWTNTSTLPTMQPEIDSSTSPEESDTRGSVTENSRNSNTGATTTLRNVVVVRDQATAQGELLLVLIIVPVLVLIAVAAFIYRKQVIKQRMDLPPSFKPPPPPVKYTAAIHLPAGEHTQSLAYET